ncbi:hypothetical protein MUP65_01935 [Patescibacteria group bacterium]|nr:hypothetical protein [Patescibacteria group bacterium]
MFLSFERLVFLWLKQASQKREEELAAKASFLMAKMNKQRVGIIGGLGPQAGVEFCRLLLEEQTRQGRRENSDFMEFILCSPELKDGPKTVDSFQILVQKLVALSQG